MDRATQTMLVHASGQFLSDVVAVPVPQITAQSLGSCVTYLRRYSLLSFTGLAPAGDDDDGEAATTEPRRIPANAARPKPRRLPAADGVTERVTGRVASIARRRSGLRGKKSTSSNCRTTDASDQRGRSRRRPRPRTRRSPRVMSRSRLSPTSLDSRSCNSGICRNRSRRCDRGRACRRMGNGRTVCPSAIGSASDSRNATRPTRLRERRTRAESANAPTSWRALMDGPGRDAGGPVSPGMARPRVGPDCVRGRGARVGPPGGAMQRLHR